MRQILTPSVSVLMPTYQQSRFIRRALDSLLAQTLTDWEAIIIDDGSRDGTAQAVLPYLNDSRFTYYKLSRNTGLGKAVNEGMARAAAPLIAYLPSDDVYYRDHLQDLKARLDTGPQTILAFSGVRHHYNRTASGKIPGFPLQLVQCMHRKTTASWVERQELETDDLERLFWAKLRGLGSFLARLRTWQQAA